MNSDLTFITNEKGKTLKDRFNVLIKDTRLFDVLVGYFYASGFHKVYKSLENTEKIRILIGISTNQQTYDLLKQGEQEKQATLAFSSAEAKEAVARGTELEFEESEDNQDIDEGVQKFVEWIKSGKLQIKAYPTEKIHAKIYIMTFKVGDRDKGRVITGSSNFSQSGLVDNLEFNVELKNQSDHKFALEKFDSLWAHAIDVSEDYIETIRTKTWFNDEITPYQLYLKFLYEYFKEDLSQQDEMQLKYLPAGFKKFQYQEQAVLNAKKILNEYGGVFISDVVGLGKTYIGSMLAGQLEGRTLVIAPPVLLDKTNPGSWVNVFSDFRIHADFESTGKLDKLLKQGVEKYSNIIIDEAHRFRTDNNVTYEKLAEICRGKKVVLVTATPYNNSPKDILSQIKLFQKSKKSTIPNLPDLEQFFSRLEKKLKNLDRQRDREEYLETVKENAKEIREKVLKYLMVRRTRTEIEKYFSNDLSAQNLKFPKVEDPKPVYYELDDEEDFVFSKTIELISQQFKYARYTPMLYYTGQVTQPEKLAQRNMGKFMKILLVKRLESSFYAFRNSLDRFIGSYEQFLSEFDKGNVFVSKKYTNKIFELIEDNRDELVENLITDGKADKYNSKDFKKSFRTDLESDLKILKEIKKLWAGVKRDPKLNTFLKKLETNPILKKNKLIIFTESKETADYLTKNISKVYKDKVLQFTGASSQTIREHIIENFDANARFPKDDYRILVCTEVLSEGVNLHRSNVVVNYDIPWNPTRMMQRVGRINRVDTKFEKVYSFNFFPTKQANDQIKLKEAAEAKISAFLSLLGGDANLLTDNEPVGAHELFDRLTSKKTIVGEEEEDSELKYLDIIKQIRENDPDLFEEIKRLPKKARTARLDKKFHQHLFSYFRKGKIQKFYIVKEGGESAELDFFSAAKILEVSKNEKRQKISKKFYELLVENKNAFVFSTTEDIPEVKLKGGRDSATQILRILKASMKDRRQFTEEQERYLKNVIIQLEEGGFPKQTTKVTLQAINKELEKGINPLAILAVLQNKIPAGLLKDHYTGLGNISVGKREVILSEYLTKA